MNDDLRGPLGMMRSLLTQLVRMILERGRLQGPNNIDMSIWRTDDPSAVNLTTNYLCELFLNLFHKIPPGVTVFCIIDDINRLDNKSEWAADFFSLKDMLDSLVRTQETGVGRGPRFKLLLTSPSKSKGFKDDVPMHQRVDLGVSRKSSMWAGLGYEQWGAPIVTPSGY